MLCGIAFDIYPISVDLIDNLKYLCVFDERLGVQWVD